MLCGNESWTKQGLRKLVQWCMPESNSAKNEQESLTEYPTISGARNQSALGKTVPLILGKTKFSPYYIGKPYLTIGGEDGKDVYYHCLYLLGYNELQVRNISLGIYKIASNDGVTEGVLPSEDYNPEESVTQDISNGELALDLNSVYSPSEYGIQLELQQGSNEVSLYDQKVVQTENGTELIHVAGEEGLKVNCFSAKFPEKIQTEIQLNGLVSYDSEGNKGEAEIKIGTSMSVDGGNTWIPFAPFTGANSYENTETACISTIKRQKNETLRFVAEKQFTYEEIHSFNDGDGIKNNVVELKIWRENEKSTNSNICDTAVLTFIRTWCYDDKLSNEDDGLVKQCPLVPLLRDKTARLGFVIKAGEDIQGQLDYLNCELTSKAYVVKNGEWNSTKEPTDNPASLLLEVLTGSFRGKYAYNIEEDNDTLTSDKIDLDSLKELYEKCEEMTEYGEEELKRFTCDGVVLKKIKTIDVANQILDTCRSMLVISGNKYGVFTDEPQENPVVILNNHNILSADNQKSFDIIPDGFNVKYISALNDYQEDSFIAKPNDMEKPEEEMILESLEMPFITNPFRAKANALYKLAVRKLRPEIWTRKVSTEGNLIKIGSLVGLQDNTISVGIGDGAEIKALVYDDEDAPTQIEGIITDTQYKDLDEELTYGVYITIADGYNNVTTIKKEIATVNGNVLTFDESISLEETVLPTVGDIVSFGIFSKIITYSICAGKKKDGDGTFTLTLVPYQEGVYTADEGMIDDFDSKVTPPQYIGKATDTRNEVTLEQLNNAINGLTRGDSSIVPEDLTNLEVIAKEDGLYFNYDNTQGITRTIYRIKAQIKRNANANWEDIIIEKDKYTFDREIDGYPEVSDLLNVKVRAKGINIYGNTSEHWVEVFIDTDTYGTWEVQQPIVNTRISDRTITLMFSQPTRTDNRQIYGNIRYKVQVKNPAIDTKYYKPATNLNPFESELNYKDGEGFVISNNIYIQTMPLMGQDDDQIIDTPYMFKVVGFNEKEVDSSFTEVTATALCTSINDLVKANDSMKESYVENLTSLCSAFGFISGGVIDGQVTNKSNYWTLNNDVLKVNDENNIAYQGAFRVGGEDQYILVKPIQIDPVTHTPQDYEVIFKVGNFQITTTSSSINGELIVQTNESSLDRTRITPTGTFYEHRDNKTSSWYLIDKMETSGVVAPSYKSNKQILIGNFTQEQQRLLGHDIGREYLTENALVWHFDGENDIKTQHGTTGGLVVNGEWHNYGEKDSVGIDFTPAIYAVAPYCTEARCLYGKFNANLTVEDVEKLTVDFWIQYLYAEEQTLFNIGTLNDKISLKILPTEPLAVVSGVSSWRKTGGVLYCSTRNPKAGDYAYSTKAKAEQGGESAYVISEVTLNDTYDVATITVNSDSYTFDSGYPDMNWETYAPEDIWGDTSAIANRADNKKIQIYHTGQTSSESVSLEDLGQSFEEYEWCHIAIVFTSSTDSSNPNKIKFLFGNERGNVEYLFTRYSSVQDDVEIILNEEQNSFILDELYVDKAVEMTTGQNGFNAQTVNRIPWAGLDKSINYFIFDAENPSLVKSNILEYFKTQLLTSNEFINAVRGVIGE